MYSSFQHYSKVSQKLLYKNVKFLQYFYVWAIWDGQSDAFTQKRLLAEGVAVIMYFWGGQAHEGDEMKKELE